jgi:hypothetical protein
MGDVTDLAGLPVRPDARPPTAEELLHLATVRALGDDAAPAAWCYFRGVRLPPCECPNVRATRTCVTMPDGTVWPVCGRCGLHWWPTSL